VCRVRSKVSFENKGFKEIEKKKTLFFLSPLNSKPVPSRLTSLFPYFQTYKILVIKKGLKNSNEIGFM